MKLRDARLCADCEEVYEAEGCLYAACPSCGSKSFYLVSRWIPTLNDFERFAVELKTTGQAACERCLRMKKKREEIHGKPA